MVVLAAPLLVDAALAGSALVTGYLASPGVQRQVRQAGRALSEAASATGNALAQAFSHQSTGTTARCPEAAKTTARDRSDDPCRRERERARSIRKQRDLAEQRHDAFKAATQRYQESPGVWRNTHPKFGRPAIGSRDSFDDALGYERTAREQKALSDEVDRLDAELGRADQALTACMQRADDRRREADLAQRARERRAGKKAADYIMDNADLSESIWKAPHPETGKLVDVDELTRYFLSYEP